METPQCQIPLQISLEHHLEVSKPTVTRVPGEAEPYNLSRMPCPPPKQNQSPHDRTKTRTIALQEPKRPADRRVQLDKWKPELTQQLTGSCPVPPKEHESECHDIHGPWFLQHHRMWGPCG